MTAKFALSFIIMFLTLGLTSFNPISAQQESNPTAEATTLKKKRKKRKLKKHKKKKRKKNRKKRKFGYGDCEQSPINLSTKKALKVNLTDIKFHYAPNQEFKVEHLGHTIQCSPTQENYIVIDGKRYDLLQFHFHTPSEHHINKKPCAAEVHFVHQNSKKGIAVIGILIEHPKNQEANSSLTALITAITSNIRKEGDTFTASFSNVADLFPTKQLYFRYEGSLTTPPYTENLKWHVFKETVKAPIELINALRQAIGEDNNRTLQKNNQPLFLDIAKDE